MDADPAAPRATTGPDLRTACEERAVVRLTLACGQVLTGNYTRPIKGRSRFVAIAKRDELAET